MFRNELMKDLLGLHTKDELDAVEKESAEAKADADEKLDENGLPGQSIIDLVEEKGSSKEEPKAKADAADKADKDKADKAKSDKTESDGKADEAKPADTADEVDSDGESENDDPDEYFTDDSDASAPAEGAQVEGRKAVNKVFVDDTSITAAEKGDDNMAGVNIADLMIRFDHEKMTASIAELLTSGGKVINPKLLEIVEYAIDKNPDTRDYIADKLPEFIREYPDNIKTYQSSVFEVARNIRVKYMLRCPENGNLYESMESFFDLMEKEDPHLAIEYGRGIKKLQEVWIKTDCDGKIVDQDRLLTEAEVRKIVLDLPKEIQDEACEKLHIPKMVVKPSKDKADKGNKPDEKK